MKINHLIFALLMTLFGCAAGNPLYNFPHFQRSNIHRVALFVEIGNRQQHVHHGTTKLSNFRKEYSLSWNLDELIKKRFIKKLADEGIDVVDLENEGFNYFQIDKLIIAKERKWVANPDYITSLKKIKNDLKAQAVVIVKGSQVAADTYVSKTGGRYPLDSMTASGLYSEYFLGIQKKFKAVAAFDVRLYLLQPPADLTFYAPLEAQNYYRVKELKGFTPPKDIKNISQEEFAPVFSSIDEYISDAASLVICSLKMGDNSDNLWDCLPDKFKSK